jgi:hypothetical protein
MLPAEFEPAIPAGEWLQTHALDLSATVIGTQDYHKHTKLIQEQMTHEYNILYDLATYTNTDRPMVM